MQIRRSLFLAFPIVALGVLGCAPAGDDDDVFSVAPTSTPYALSEISAPTIWTALNGAIAVDSQDRVFVTNGSSVFVITGSTPSVYLSQAAIQAGNGGATPAIIGLDVGPDDRLYLLDDSFASAALVVTTAGQVVIHRDFAGVAPMHMVVPSVNRMLVVDYLDGLYAVTATSETLIYGAAAMGGVQNCASQDFTASGGFIYYLPGCNGSPIVGGLDDGSGIGILAEQADLGHGFKNFSGVGRDPSGGAAVQQEEFTYHFDGTNFVELKMLPTFATLVAERSIFSYYSEIAAGPSGALYIVSDGYVFRADPP